MKKTLTKAQQEALAAYIEAAIKTAEVNLFNLAAQMDAANKTRPRDKQELANLLGSYRYWEGQLAALKDVRFEAQLKSMQ